MHLNRREFIAVSSAAVAATTVGAQSKKKYKACIIGDSKMGGYGHCMEHAFGLRDDVATVALADPDESGRVKYAKIVGVERSYADYREMLEKERPDLVSVGPRCTIKHEEYLLACTEVGAHGFIEKPLCDDLAVGDKMVAAVEARNLKWAIAFIFRSMPEVQHAWKMIHEEGLIGTVLEARGRGKEDHRAGGEDLIVLGAHVLDLMCFFMGGKPLWCTADVTVNGRTAQPADVRRANESLGPIVGDRIHVMYGFKGGTVGYFDSMKNPNGNGGRFGIDIYGSRGVVAIRILPGDLRISVQWFEGSLWAPGRKSKGWKPLPDAPVVQVKDKHRERNQIITDDLIAAIEEDRRPKISIQDGLRSWEMTQAVFESCVQGGARVALPLVNRSHPLKSWK
ncbi:MAG: Gfo/Idh/MocA family oxidoreductase [Kiritimatiellae bacterium]|jgi:predicted dehydrogenase|nr:Gfo/Idh/MocA family oxidoreductase [Kiritimatiellia bacterium]